MFYPRTVTVPADGEFAEVDVAGKAVVTQSMGVYSGPEEVPLLRFGDTSRPGQPLYPASIYVSQDGNAFDRFFIEGSSESEGDLIYFLVSDVCIEPDINPTLNDLVRATFKNTFTIVASDTAQFLSPVQIAGPNDQQPTRMYVDVNAQSTGSADSGILYTFDDGSGISPDNSTDPVTGISLRGGANFPVEIDGIEFIEAFNFVSRITGEAPLVHFTLEY